MNNFIWPGLHLSLFSFYIFWYFHTFYCILLFCCFLFYVFPIYMFPIVFYCFIFFKYSFFVSILAINCKVVCYNLRKHLFTFISSKFRHLMFSDVHFPTCLNKYMLWISNHNEWLSIIIFFYTAIQTSRFACDTYCPIDFCCKINQNIIASNLSMCTCYE